MVTQSNFEVKYSGFFVELLWEKKTNYPLTHQAMHKCPPLFGWKLSRNKSPMFRCLLDTRQFTIIATTTTHSFQPDYCRLFGLVHRRPLMHHQTAATATHEHSVSLEYSITVHSVRCCSIATKCSRTFLLCETGKRGGTGKKRDRIVCCDIFIIQDINSTSWWKFQVLCCVPVQHRTIGRYCWSILHSHI